MKRLNYRNLLPPLALTTGVSLSLAMASTAQAEQQSMIVAGGCFWCVESDFEMVPGVIDVISGYTGGQTVNPTYKQVSVGNTGHYEAVTILFDDQQVSLTTLAEYFWKTIDPTDPNGQFCDKGAPYRTAMFYQSAEQKAVFDASLNKVNTSKPFTSDIVTPILPATEFYPAEEYHQSYYTKNPIRYAFYRSSCGRDRRVEGLWGDVASKKYH
ncbi:peptide-methionine (S)-S-oxide reductase MsrA [Marinomonas sp. TW1]|uniref:peptide-methionine (S)-S-oxide reductase MsrA n=1 Tax=Marinomonas sp. TW1 TaxID=1561203 RepID=UPI0007AFDA58|nr:peptide-methionine (S)-S-oxide reductase MsrA [Marinomonas sp. TW1]KZN15121.1 peptide methionine sulfoxide reductase [Marinomonas sp. TW1]